MTLGSSDITAQQKVGQRPLQILAQSRLRSSKNWFPIAVWLFSRILILLWGAVVVTFLPVRQIYFLGQIPEQSLGQVNVFLEPWARWDTLWYLRIAANGYSQGDLTGGFFPLYPLLIRGLTIVVGNPLLSALLISNLALLAALLLFYRMACYLHGETTARRAVLYWMAFPTSFYFFAGYAESLFVLSAIMSVQAALTRRFMRAGWSGACAALSRPPGFLVAIPLAIEWVQARGSTGERVRRAIPFLLIPAAIGLFMLYLYLAFGDPFFWLHAWNNVTVSPWSLVIRTGQAIADGKSLGNNVIDLGFTLFILALSILGIRRVPLSLTLFSFSLILVQMMAYPPALGFADMPMAGLARRVAVVFPAFLVLGQIWLGRFKEPVWVGISVCIQLLFISIFVRWLWLD